MNWWLNKEDVLYICNGILLSHKKSEIFLCATTQMDLEDIMISDISQTEKDEDYVSLIHEISKTNELYNKTK